MISEMNRAHRALLALAAIGLVGSLATAGDGQPRATADPEPRLRVEMKPLPDGVRQIWLEAGDGSGPSYVIELDGGGEERVSPAELAARLARDHRHRSPLYRLLNITSPVGFAWVALGLLGQVLFTGRMVLQWLTSERAQRSVVPVGFWWMSLGGASMLMVYFVWRRDIVGVLGQSAGWLIYARNLWLICHPPTQFKVKGQRLKVKG